MVKPSIKYAVLCGIFLAVVFWISLNFGSNPLLDIRHFFVDSIIFILFIYFAIREFKTYHNDGYLHFWQGMTIALVVYLPAAVIFSMFLLLMLQIDPSAMENYRQGAMALLEGKKAVLLEGISQEEYEQHLAAIEKISISDLVVDSIMKKSIAGFFITPVVSIILRKKP